MSMQSPSRQHVLSGSKAPLSLDAMYELLSDSFLFSHLLTFFAFSAYRGGHHGIIGIISCEAAANCNARWLGPSINCAQSATRLAVFLVISPSRLCQFMMANDGDPFPTSLTWYHP